MLMSKNVNNDVSKDSFITPLYRNHTSQEPMSGSMQLTCIPVTAFSHTDLFLDRISLE